MTAAKPSVKAVDLSRPKVARLYDYLLGGRDNFAADRALADQIIARLPEVQIGVRAQRAVLGRVVRYLVAEAGVRQLLDIGSGLPTADNVHEIAQRSDPATAARVVYVDNDRCKPGCSHGRRVRRMSSARADADQPLTGRQSRAGRLPASTPLDRSAEGLPAAEADGRRPGSRGRDRGRSAELAYRLAGFANPPLFHTAS